MEHLIYPQSEKTWKAIDPHGVIGQRVFETCNFIRSEIEMTSFEKNNIAALISLVSEYFAEDKALVGEALFVYLIEKIIHYTKNKADPNRISYNIHVAKEILKYLSFC